MKKNILSTYIFVAVLWCVICNACKNGHVRATNMNISNSVGNHNFVSFDSSIFFIDQQIVDLSVPDDLFASQEFITLYENPSNYIKDALCFLSEENASIQQKKISIYAMQNLEVNSYIEFCIKSVDLFDKNKIDESLLKLIINPNFAGKYTIIKNYNNDKVLRLLNCLISNVKITKEFKKFLNEVVSGKSWTDVKVFNKENK